jgi:hypothetical protein
MRVNREQHIRRQAYGAPDTGAYASGNCPSLRDIVADFGNVTGVLLLLALVVNVLVTFVIQP